MTTEIKLIGYIGAGANTWQHVYTELAKDKTGDVEVLINSDGGSLQEALSIHGLLKKHRGKVTTRNIAITASAATIPFLAGSERIVDRGAITMVHASSDPRGGNAEQLRQQIKALDVFDHSMVDIIAATTGKAREAVASQVLAETLLTADQAVEHGYATRVGDQSAVAAVWSDTKTLIEPVESMDIKSKLGLPADATEDQVSAALDAVLIKAKPAEPAPVKTEPAAQPDIAALVSAAVSDAFAAREAAAAAVAPVVSQEELHNSAAQAAVERFIGEGKIPPANREIAIQACGKTSASLGAVIAFWERQPRVVAPVTRGAAPADNKPQLSQIQKSLAAQAGMTEEAFAAEYFKGARN